MRRTYGLWLTVLFLACGAPESGQVSRAQGHGLFLCDAGKIDSCLGAFVGACDQFFTRGFVNPNLLANLTRLLFACCPPTTTGVDTPESELGGGFCPFLPLNLSLLCNPTLGPELQREACGLTDGDGTGGTE